MPGGLYQIKCDTIELDFDALVINGSIFRCRPHIKPTKNANCDKFPEIHGKDCDPLKVI